MQAQEAERITQTIKEHTLRYLKVIGGASTLLQPKNGPLPGQWPAYVVDSLLQTTGVPAG